MDQTHGQGKGQSEEPDQENHYLGEKLAGLAAQRIYDGAVSGK